MGFEHISIIFRHFGHFPIIFPLKVAIKIQAPPITALLSLSEAVASTLIVALKPAEAAAMAAMVCRESLDKCWIFDF